MDLLFAHDKGEPVLEEGLDGSSAAGEADQVEEHVGHLANLGASARDLPRQRWAVVAPKGPEGDHLVDAARALIEKRARDQEAPALTLRVAPKMDAQAAIEWKRNVYPDLYGDNEVKRPLYLCILGDMDGVSLATQQVLAIDGLPGRLVCPDDDGYESYVEKVLAWERSPSDHEQPRSIFYTVHDGTAATRSGYDKLVKPCYDLCHTEWQEERHLFPAASIEDAGDRDDPYPDEFLDLIAQRHPTVLFSMSHGMGPPRGRDFTPEQARERQGAMHFGAEGALLPRDVASAHFLPGGLWFYFACFGAGTPTTSDYHHWLTMLHQNGMEDLGPLQSVLRGLSQNGGFTSGIAQAALANRNGPLAIMGHVDLAWSYSYEELQVGEGGRVSGTNRATNFREILRKMVERGNRVGMTFLELQRISSTISQGLNTHYDRCKRRGVDPEGASESERLALGNLWMLHQDLRGYVLLGDPAAQLPLRNKDQRNKEQSMGQKKRATTRENKKQRGKGRRELTEQEEQRYVNILGFRPTRSRHNARADDNDDDDD
ncbi:MAG: hypothetical protein MJE77_09455 [Proteobacteria bacterium]|nr:hypothetical protein [Pseudomonadota bacterium]